MAAKVLISTTPFGESGREPLERLDRAGYPTDLREVT